MEFCAFRFCADKLILLFKIHLMLMAMTAIHLAAAADVCQLQNASSMVNPEVRHAGFRANQNSRCH